MTHRQKRAVRLYSRAVRLDPALPDRLMDERKELLGAEAKPAGETPEAEPQMLNAAILSANMCDFSEKLMHSEPRELYDYINRVLRKILPILREGGAVIDRFADAGASALFPEKPEAALLAAVSMCSELRSEPGFSVGIASGPVLSGRIGDPGSSSTLNISEHAEVSRFLQSCAQKYNAHILVTNAFTAQIPEFQRRFSSRCLGRLLIRSLGCFEEIYDVFDGDELPQINGKRRTRLMFEKGVHLFEEKNYGESRLHFVEVLKSDWNDRAAREYLNLCDACQNSDTGEAGRTYFEAF